MSAAGEWPKGSHRGDELHGLHLGDDTRHAELLMSDIRAVLEDRAALLEALLRLSALTPGTANAATARDLHLTVKAIADTAIAKATAQ